MRKNVLKQEICVYYYIYYYSENEIIK